jgi:hypothetical protein
LSTAATPGVLEDDEQADSVSDAARTTTADALHGMDVFDGFDGIFIGDPSLSFV